MAEVLAAGIQCIAANRTALAEFVDEPGGFGIDYPPNAVELAEPIIRIKDSHPSVGPLSDRISTWDRVVERYERVYKTLTRANCSGASKDPQLHGG